MATKIHNLLSECRQITLIFSSLPWPCSVHLNKSKGSLLIFLFFVNKGLHYFLANHKFSLWTVITCAVFHCLVQYPLVTKRRRSFCCSSVNHGCIVVNVTFSWKYVDRFKDVCTFLLLLLTCISSQDALASQMSLGKQLCLTLLFSFFLFLFSLLFFLFLSFFFFFFLIFLFSFFLFLIRKKYDYISHHSQEMFSWSFCPQVCYL